MTARLFFFMALVVPAMLFAESREEGVSMPFGSVSVIPDHGGSQPGTVGAFLHRFYHSSSAGHYGEVRMVPGGKSLNITEESEFFSPGYYKVRSDSPGMEIRVTAAAEGAAHRYAYFTSSGSPQKEGSIMLDLLGNAGEQSARDVVAEVRVTDPVTVTGYVISRGERETVIRILPFGSPDR